VDSTSAALDARHRARRVSQERKVKQWKKKRKEKKKGSFSRTR